MRKLLIIFVLLGLGFLALFMVAAGWFWFSGKHPKVAWTSPAMEKVIAAEWTDDGKCLVYHGEALSLFAPEENKLLWAAPMSQTALDTAWSELLRQEYDALMQQRQDLNSQDQSAVMAYNQRAAQYQAALKAMQGEGDEGAPRNPDIMTPEQIAQEEARLKTRYQLLMDEKVFIVEDDPVAMKAFTAKMEAYQEEVAELEQQKMRATLGDSEAEVEALEELAEEASQPHGERPLIHLSSFVICADVKRVAALDLGTGRPRAIQPLEQGSPAIVQPAHNATLWAGNPGMDQAKALYAKATYDQIEMRPLPERERLIQGDPVDERMAIGFNAIPIASGLTHTLAEGQPLQIEVQLVETIVNEVEAMREASEVKVEEPSDNFGQGAMEIMQVIENDLTREMTGGKMQVDESRYRLVVREPGGAVASQLEVTGPPIVIPAKSIALVAAGKTLYAFDAAGREMWQTPLPYGVPEAGTTLRRQAAAPEKEGLLYFADAGIIGAYEVKSGKPRWRQPWVGVTKMVPADDGSLYVIGSGKDPDALKYALEVKVGEMEEIVLGRLSPEGKVLWKVPRYYQDVYVSGKYVYGAFSSFNVFKQVSGVFGSQDDEGGDSNFRFSRINPANGKPIGEFFEDRTPDAIEPYGHQVLFQYSDGVKTLRIFDPSNPMETLF